MELEKLTTDLQREYDACGIFSQIEKSGQPSYDTVRNGLDALRAMRHRAGYVNHEGDGCGLLLDIPRALWASRLESLGQSGRLVHEPGFWVGHFLLEKDVSQEPILRALAHHGMEPVAVIEDHVDESVLGPLGKKVRPHFIQMAGCLPQRDDARVFAAFAEIDELPGVHVASLSHDQVVYKVVGNDETLYRFYKDLQNPLCRSAFVIAHTRYSTNTTTSFPRVQPFSCLGHNGEINTIARFYTESKMIGVPVRPEFSDSQMVDRTLCALVATRGWSLFEAAELLFPPIIHEIKSMSEELSDLYMYYRSLWGPFAQGPAGVMMRYGQEAVFSVDALGLRPMWQLESETAYYFSSEQGIVPLDIWTAEPKPLAPGEKVGVRWSETGVKIYAYDELQLEVLELAKRRFNFRGEHRNLHFAVPYGVSQDVAHAKRDAKPLDIRMLAFGFRDDDLKLMDQEIQSGAEPIKSLGFDSPIGALSEEATLLSDYLHETVAVVTNPAIDREREIEHFSTRSVLGRRPSFDGLYQEAPRVEVQAPILLEGLPESYGVEYDEIQNLAHRFGTVCYEDALAMLRTSPNGTAEILIHRRDGEGVAEALERFSLEALEAVQAGAHVIVLDDRLQFRRGPHIDPFLVVSAVHRALLRPAAKEKGEHLRRRTSLILRSGGIRNLHDIMVSLGLGADAVVPYHMWEYAAHKGGLHAIENLYKALTKGIEKVISTLGIHEVRGYERLFSAIGLAEEVAEYLAIPNFCGSQTAGLTFARMEEMSELRRTWYEAQDRKSVRPNRLFQLYPRIWKTAGSVANGELPYEEFVAKLQQFEADNPISIRHLLGFREDVEPAEGEIDTTIDGHAYPMVISSMSFGSQNETAYRAYAEAAYRMNIVCLNGEGGEIKDLLEKYPRNRGRQIASGRFGVNADLCNNAYVLEIKIGQGAKPGEGGHLPGSKVTAQVAAARNATQGVDLISPSNNHDIYSIEDLAQVIYELKEINPLAKVAVKVPVVPNIGTIAVGIAKAGADVITLSGFDGGTGAARAHAIRHVGLPMEIGVKLAHEALCEAGLREYVELWADGGMKSGHDVMKAILLGANRVGFGTMAMVAIGCTACRACHKDTCHVGIATQMHDLAEAQAKGLKQFEPQDFDRAVSQLVRFFSEVGKHVEALTRKLGAKRTQDLVGRTDLLVNLREDARLDTSWLLRVREEYVGQGCHIRYRTFEEAYGDVVQDVAAVGAATGTDGVVAAVGSSVKSIRAVPRALGTRLSGESIRQKRRGEVGPIVHEGVAGAGFAAYHTEGMVSVALGGAQDGVGKAAFGGKIVVLKGKCADGVWRGGSVGKGLAYGAARGLFIIQGNADARACIRLSGADVVIGGELEAPVRGDLSHIANRANIKGFAFEYMTGGRAVVLGDPGPWICSGMTGGRVYLRHDPEMGLDEKALRRRIAKGAKVALRVIDAQGRNDIVELLGAYQLELRRYGQHDEARRLQKLIDNPSLHFLMVEPAHEITDQDIATE
ncbi:glutamate synthase-related protein [Alicyclobacillus sendaiensis]|uniref:Glutamate synthase-related protein n=1 Tax=Alicyclobacillus sendaiensis PA2 TaxID=3029425 RepID=A0ABT6Y013_ALISE|nr:glutamate synthase-related protein [Alicyclobacillus sendaiensis]MDI9260667.1 glutamate synthase-related protein [Alicyclobacillus sendaiensis PA2]